MAQQHNIEDGNRAMGNIAVAIDKDKNSSFAVKWAIDHLLISNPFLILIHVKTKNQSLTPNQSLPHNPQYDSGNEASAEANGGETDTDLPQLFKPFRAYCARKGITMKEVIIEGTDVSRALLDYINANFITSIVVGASSRTALSRKFRNHDVPTNLNKCAPDFSSVYVITKGRPLSVRPAARPAANCPTPPRQPSPQPQHLLAQCPPSDPSEIQEGIRAQLMKAGQKGMGHERTRSRHSPTNMSMDLNFHGKMFGNHGSHFDGDFQSPLGLGSINVSPNIDFTTVPESPKDRYTNSSSCSKEMEAEMKRLRLELKQTMNMYNTACKEAISEKLKAKELHQSQMEEHRKFEQALQAEEAALAMAEMEKAKCRAAMDAAEKAQKLAEMEGLRRRYAEQKARRETEEKDRALNVLSKQDVRYRKYSIEEIEMATDNFAPSAKIGEGGYGPVFKAKLDHTSVAIKVLRPDAAQGRKQFQQEVEVLSCIRHPNMVLLLGACPEFGCLVYEFMNYGSLEDRLFRKDNTPSIPWRIRFKIAAEIATGLLFLHQAKPEPLVHRDLKPANILLDRNYVCKISDVGLARLVPPSVANTVTQYHMTSAAGTFCYIDPEYQQTGMLGIKSDIYSLGIMLLQIITGRPPIGLTHYVERAIGKGTFADMLDPTVPDWPIEEALSFAKLAIKCAELRKKDRPDLDTDIVPELNRLKDIGTENGASDYSSRSSGWQSQISSPGERFSTVNLQVESEEGGGH